MPISTTCPRCKALFRLSDDMAGKIVTCQKCQGFFLVPVADDTHVVAGKQIPGSGDADANGESTPAPAMDLAAPETMNPPPPILEEEPIPVELAESIQEGRSKKRTPEPPAIPKPSRSEVLTRGKIKQPAKSKAWLFASIAILAGGVLSCCVCSAGVGVWAYVEHERRMAINPFGGIEVKFDRNDTFRNVRVLKETDPLEQFDPLFAQKRHNLYVARLEAGRTYQIDMETNDFNFDAYLHMRDDQDEIVARDDDGAGFPNARIVYRPLRTGFYRIYATSLNGFQFGNYSLTVRRF